MALIKCEECGAEISDKADFCPHCGYKRQAAQQNTQAQLVSLTPNQPFSQNQAQGQYQPPYYNPYYNPNYEHYTYNRNRYIQGNANVFGIIGFILSLASLFLSLWGIIPITGLVFSIIGLIIGKQQFQKTGLALSGIIISSISLLYTIVQLILWESLSLLLF